MVDFLKIATSKRKKDLIIEVFPKFILKESEDLMIRGQDFYAVWDESRGIWSTKERDVISLIDKELSEYANKIKNENPEYEVYVKYMWDSDSGSIDKWHKYCKLQMRDNYHMLDEELIFSNMEVNKKNYASKQLTYPLEPGSCKAWDTLISTLYSEEERYKIEWAIGAVVTGDSKTIQKFLVLYGAAGTGKSTILNIIEKLFDGYHTVFEAKTLGSSSAQFALEAFKDNPLVAIQQDGDLSKIEDNTRLNSLISHEEMLVNEKYKASYRNRFKAFLFLGTNKPVKITDAKSGLIRRLIDVSPTGVKIPINEYRKLISQIDFELGAIAWHCKEVYLSDPGKYDNYIPINMLGATNDFYNFVESAYRVFSTQEHILLKSAWSMYKEFCDDAKVPYPYTQRVFKEELKNYFWRFEERTYIDGVHTSNVYYDFRTEIFNNQSEELKIEKEEPWLLFNCSESIFDKICSDYLAQYATDKGTPINKWERVTRKLSDIDTSKLHYVKVPENHIVIDFDIPDGNGDKCFEMNLEEASKWPETYAELSKSGGGIHLHYIYNGDVNKLSRLYKENIEIKVFTGNSSLRRMLTKCNDKPINTISSGLPLKGGKKMTNFETIKSERTLRNMIEKNLKKEIHGSTTPSVHFINKLLQEAYDGGLKYDVSDMRNAVLAFAANSSNQADICIRLVNDMHFKSDDIGEYVESKKDIIVFYDIEVFPNLFLVNWKYAGEENPVIRMINPTPAQIESMLQYKLIGFNNRAYDNHMIYACMMGYTVEELYRLSTRLVSKDKEVSRKAKFGEAYNLSYTDVYDFAATKQSLKKWEIQLGIHHQELGLPWDEPVPEDKWQLVAEYCDNDVIATEAVFNHCKGDFTARQILAELAGGCVNDTTNTLTTKIIFGNVRNPQDRFNYRDMGEVSNEDIIPDGFDSYTRFNKKGQAVFPSYEFDKYTRKSRYRNENPSEGGYIYAEPGMYGNVALLDIVSLHPTSAIVEKIFGIYTKNFEDIKRARVYIKRKMFDKARLMLDGKLAPYLNDESTAKDLAQALKIAINSVYGLTKAKFPNPFKDSRNEDNIVAKRGALFMINLKHEVQKRGFIVVHIKTDSIKIADATPEIIQFVMEYGKMYGYDFEHEATYDRICLVNDAVYIAKYANGEQHEFELSTGQKIMTEWTATGTQFQVPYVFKSLFCKAPIRFEDLCETKSTKVGALYLDMNEKLELSITEKEAELKVMRRELNKILKKEPDNTDKIADLKNSIDSLTKQIEESHNYMFVGRVGQFCPVKPGTGGGSLYYKNDAGKYVSVSGTKGYKWFESELVRNLSKDSEIDMSYYDNLVNEAAEAISFYGDLEWFCSNDPYIVPKYDENGKPDYIEYYSQPAEKIPTVAF